MLSLPFNSSKHYHNQKLRRKNEKRLNYNESFLGYVEYSKSLTQKNRQPNSLCVFRKNMG